MAYYRKWNNTFQKDMFLKDIQSSANKLNWDDDRRDQVASIIEKAVKKRNYDEGVIIKQYREFIESIGWIISPKGFPSIEKDVRKTFGGSLLDALASGSCKKSLESSLKAVIFPLPGHYRLVIFSFGFCIWANGEAWS